MKTEQILVLQLHDLKDTLVSYISILQQRLSQEWKQILPVAIRRADTQISQIIIIPSVNIS